MILSNSNIKKKKEKAGRIIYNVFLSEPMLIVHNHLSFSFLSHSNIFLEIRVYLFCLSLSASPVWLSFAKDT